MEIEVHEVTAEGGEVYSTESSKVQQTTRGVNRIIWLISERWPQVGSWSVIMGWTAGICQLASGILLIIGLFTRIAALIVCAASALAVYLVAFHMHGMFYMNPFEWPLDTHRFLQLFAGLSIFTLSLGLMSSGAGGLSINRRHRMHKEPAKNSNEE